MHHIDTAPRYPQHPAMGARPGTASQPVYATGPGGGRGTLDDLLGLLRRPAWQADALCIEYPEVNFFPERGEPSAPAKAVCERCLVRPECLAWALEHGQGPGLGGGHGVWAGTSARQRREMSGGLVAEIARERDQRRLERRLELVEQRRAREERRRRLEAHRQALVAAWLEDPARSVREVADMVGVAYGAAYKVRRELEDAGQLAPRTPAA